MSRVQANRQYLISTAEQLENGVQFTPEQMKFWAMNLRRIGEGEPADKVLNLRLKRGEKSSDEVKRRKISFILHLIASYYNPIFDPRFDPNDRPKKYTLEESIKKVQEEIPNIMGDGYQYSFEQVRDWWYDADKKHMQSPFRNRLDPDNPYSV